MIFDANELAQAVFFFDEQGRLIKELHIAEFQAVLDGFVGLSDLSGVEARACYAEINSELKICKLLFFTLPVNPDGSIHKAWHLPLANLAASGFKGRDLGAGPILMSCHSQCPAVHLKRAMWDPELGPENNTLLILKKAAAENKMGLLFRSPETVAAHGAVDAESIERMELELGNKLRKEHAKEMRDHMAQLLKEQRLRIATMNSEFENQKQLAKQQFEQRLESQNQALLSSQQELTYAQAKISELEAELAQQSDKIASVRDYFTRKIDDVVGSEQEQQLLLRESIELELKAKFEHDDLELKQRLQSCELELLYRQELEEQLQSELAMLRQRAEGATSLSAEQLLQNLSTSGLTLVSFQPGTGHLTVPVDKVQQYIDGPEAYAATHCGVSEGLYLQWLEHYKVPICRAELETGAVCGENVERVDKPIDFSSGVSDRCPHCQKLASRAHLKLAST
ncbi:hypothetical protein [Agaribacterium sp. ZY112]|uniref:hypothetical protein n=1 Tax=Agaribacterium sp. ZY112 TaxID=3233574 RepID=UPI00352493CC